ncbi:MAG TPA: tetratricopeptide repeat protein [Vicinamibacterales bacterium]|nr:tetratricopeptide repeat protein [Vicinamibacterales bacterium]
MASDIAALERRAIEFARLGDFGEDATDLNRALTRLSPGNQGAWTRLARCCMEQELFDDAAAALIQVLELNPSNNIAKSLQQEVIRRRAMAPVRSDAASGFTPQDFYTLGQLASVDAARALTPKFESLLTSVNAQRTSSRIVEARNREGQSGSKLFRRNSFYAGLHGHVFAFHHGGRWEPQFNLGMFSATPWGASSFRSGIAFNMSPAGSDPDREAGQANALLRFERFQQQLAGAWGGHLVDWMSKSGGFIQYGERGPATDLLPRQGVDWIVNCRNPAGIGFVFIGRWLFLENPDDAATLGDMRKLVAAIEDTFAALFPLWLSVYGEDTGRDPGSGVRAPGSGIRGS